MFIFANPQFSIGDEWYCRVDVHQRRRKHLNLTIRVRAVAEKNTKTAVGNKHKESLQFSFTFFVKELCMNELKLWDDMAIKSQTKLLLVALLLLIAATALSINHQVNTLSYLEQEYSSTESQLSELMKEWEVLTFERWMLLNLGTYPRNASLLNATGSIEAFVFYSNDVSEENLMSRFDPLAESFDITVAYLGLMNQTNLNTLEEICGKAGFPQPSPWQSYVIVLNSSKIICLRLEHVDDEVFSKCVEYLRLSMPET